MGRLEQEIPVKVYGNGEVTRAILIRDLQDSLNDVVVYPEQERHGQSSDAPPKSGAQQAQ